MNRKLENEFLKLEKRKEQVLHMVRDLSQENFNKQPSSYSWSAAMVLDHLLLAEKGSLAYLKKKNNSPAQQLPNVGPAGFFRHIFLYLMLAGPFKFKAPKVLTNPENRDFDHIQSDWEELRSDLKNFLENYPDEKLNKAIFKHPLVGRLSMRSALSFTSMHIKHHMSQLERIRKQLDS